MTCKLCGGTKYDDICENIKDTAHVMSLLDLIECQDKLLVAYRLRSRPTDKLLERMRVLREELGL